MVKVTDRRWYKDASEREDKHTSPDQHVVQWFSIPKSTSSKVQGSSPCGPVYFIVSYQLDIDTHTHTHIHTYIYRERDRGYR